MLADTSPESRATLARLAGLAYLVIIAAGLWSELGVRAALVVPGDPAATAAAILGQEGLFRLSLAADTVMAVADVALAVLLFALLAPAGPVLSLMAMAFRLIQAAILGANLILQYLALSVLQSGGAEAGGAALLLMDAQSHGYDLGLVFFGVNCLLVGTLLWRAADFPRLLGAGMAAAGAVYLTGSAVRFLAPDLTGAVAPAYAICLLAEAAFCVTLLGYGLRGRVRAAV